MMQEIDGKFDCTNVLDIVSLSSSFEKAKKKNQFKMYGPLGTAFPHVICKTLWTQSSKLKVEIEKTNDNQQNVQRLDVEATGCLTIIVWILGPLNSFIIITSLLLNLVHHLIYPSLTLLQYASNDSNPK